MYNLAVEKGKSYLLRIINAALNEELFLKIAGHTLSVVEVDASYVKAFTTDTILIAPGQTTNALLKADQKSAKYLLTASTFMDAPVAIDNITATATLHYTDTLSSSSSSSTIVPTTPPKQNDTNQANKFHNSLKSLNSNTYPAKLPLETDHSLFFTIGLGVIPCPSCKPANGSRVVGAVNNVTFVMPDTALLQAHYFKINGVFTTDFPSRPPHVFNYTGAGPHNLNTTSGTKVYRVGFNETVELVMQDTGIIAPESHPVHLHGFNFFVVGRGVGNYDPKKDPKSFNLVDPVERNTVGVPAGGWTAIRFRADNPGIKIIYIYLHFNLFICH